MTRPTVLSIAGSDCTGGAGIQADNATVLAMGGLPCNVVTAITAQNSQGVRDVCITPSEVLVSQWQSVMAETQPSAIKLGMLGNEHTLEHIAHQLQELQAINVPVVCDPVLKATAGGLLIDKPAAYRALLPYVQVFTPNQEEFCEIFEVTADSLDTLMSAAQSIAAEHKIGLVITGGDSTLSDDAVDICVLEGQSFFMHSARQSTPHTHGSGCSFSSALATALARGYRQVDAAVLAKTYLNQGLTQPPVSGLPRAGVQHTYFPNQVKCLPAISKSATKTTTEFSAIGCELGPYPVVDSVEWIEKCLKEGVKTLQLRVKEVDAEQLEAMIIKTIELGRHHHARVFINDYWQLAVKHGAYGVHLGQEDLDIADIEAICKAGLKLGISNHSWFELARGLSLTPSYIAIGPIYETTTKQMPFAPQGLTQLQEWVRLLDSHYPIVAIGGIDLSNASDVLATGVGSVAMVRAVTEANNYKEALAAFSDLCSTAAQ